MSWDAVMGVEGIEQGTQHATLRGASAEGCGCMGGHFYPLIVSVRKSLTINNLGYNWPFLTIFDFTII